MPESIEHICCSFESSWEKNEVPELDHYLDQLDHPQLKQQLFCSLLTIDIRQRQRRSLTFSQRMYELRYEAYAKDIARIFAESVDVDLEKESFKTTSFPLAAPESPPNDPYRTQSNPTGPSSHSRASATTSQCLGSYVLLNKIAEHGQGIVYRANHPTLHRQVVIKVNNAVMAQANPSGLLDEARLLAKLNHPNVATVYDLQCTDEGQIYLVMEYIEGRNLADLQKEDRLDLAASLRMMMDVCSGLQHAHDLGILHLDLKPGNIVLRAADKVPKIIDFGLAQLRPIYGNAENSTYGGTWQYMAPEQAALLLDGHRSGEVDRALDPRADVFSLGVILVELLTGRRFRPKADSVRQGLQIAAANGLDEELFSGSRIPPKLAAICRRALATDPAQRLASAAELADLLSKASRPVGRSVIPSGLAVASVAVLASLAALSFSGRSGGAPGDASEPTVDRLADNRGRRSARGATAADSVVYSGRRRLVRLPPDTGARRIRRAVWPVNAR